MYEDVSNNSKATIRARVRANRAALSAPDREQTTGQLTTGLTTLAERLLPRTLACYSARPTEPDTGPFIEWALARDIEVLLPVSLPESQLDWVRLDAHAGMAPGRHSIAEPLGRRLGADALLRADLVLVPACAVDQEGTRLGWGMGYYDRCLGAIPSVTPVYAVVFDSDRFSRLPRDPHDVPVTGVACPSEVAAF